MHKTGDLLVISDFSIGGTTSTINVYEWNPDCKKAGQRSTVRAPAVTRTCSPLASSNSANCSLGGSELPTAASSTPGTEPRPRGHSSTRRATASFGQGEFFEAGIDLSYLGLGDRCYSSVMSETRSSTSTTATLKDFVLGNFENCSATAVTTPSATTVSPGEQVTDTIEITGAGTGTPPFPSSPANIVFSYCGPIAVGGTCDSSDGAHTAAAFGSSKALSPTATPGKSTATSDAINTAAVPLAPGYYCFVGSWAGDANYTDGAKDGGTNECFTVRKINTTTVTTPSNGSGTALVGAQALGTTIYDKAVVTAAASGGGDVTGTVSFFVCDPSQITGAAGSQKCASTDGTAVTGNPVTLTPIASSDPPASSALSGGVVANKAGLWCFRATYTPSGTVYNGSSDNADTECVSINPENTTTTTTPSKTTGVVNDSVTDTAVVAAIDNADGWPTGTVTFYICTPTVVTAMGGDCDNSGSRPAGATQVGTAKTLSEKTGQATPSAEATSDAYQATAVGTYCFRAEYSPSGTNGANYNGSADGSTTECFTITDSTNASSTQSWLPNDTAAISSVGGSALNGTLSIQLYTGDSCADANIVSGYLYTKSLTNATTPQSLTTSNTDYFVTETGSVSWKVTFTSSDLLVSSSSHCEKSSLTITN